MTSRQHLIYIPHRRAVRYSLIAHSSNLHFTLHSTNSLEYPHNLLSARVGGNGGTGGNGGNSDNNRGYLMYN